MIIRALASGQIGEHTKFFPHESFSERGPSAEFLRMHNCEEYTPEPYVPTPEELEQRKQANIARLWQDATNYQEKYISGAALSLLTIGVMQSKPKSLAIMQWIQDIWNNHYYVQKPLVTENYAPYDFSVCGAMPYSVPELSEEVLAQ